MVSCLTVKSLSHFDFSFVYGVRECSNFPDFHVAVQLSQHRLLKRLSFLHCILQPPLLKILGIYPEKMKTLIQKDACIPVFIAALFTIAKTWKQIKRSSTEEWIKKMWYIYTMEYFSAIKKRMKQCHLQQHGWTLEIIILSEVSQKGKDKYHMISLICGI